MKLGALQFCFPRLPVAYLLQSHKALHSWSIIRFPTASEGLIASFHGQGQCEAPPLKGQQF